MTSAEALIAALVEVGVPPAELVDRDRPLAALLVDSFDILQAIALVEDALGTPIDPAALRGVLTVADLFDAVAAQT